MTADPVDSLYDLAAKVDEKDVTSLAERVKGFLTEHGVNTQREHHPETDIWVLATVE